MEQKKVKGLRLHGPILTQGIRGWKGVVSFVNIGLSVAVVGLVVFNFLFYLSRVELPTEVEPAAMEAQRRPAVVTATPRRDISDYAPIVSKNIFSPDRGEWEDDASQVVKQSREAETDETLAKSSGLSLLGVIIAGEVKKALLRGKGGNTFLREGEEIEGYRVVGIEPKRVYLSLNGKEFSIGLYKDLPSLTGEGIPKDKRTIEEPWEEPEVALGEESSDPYEPGGMERHREGLGRWRPSPTRP